jgi:hypothetical protein
MTRVNNHYPLWCIASHTNQRKTHDYKLNKGHRFIAETRGKGTDTPRIPRVGSDGKQVSNG